MAHCRCDRSLYSPCFCLVDFQHKGQGEKTAVIKLIKGSKEIVADHTICV